MHLTDEMLQRSHPDMSGDQSRDNSRGIPFQEIRPDDRQQSPTKSGASWGPSRESIAGSILRCRSVEKCLEIH
ncbi:hypothetical protein QTJ16_002494 [Diplocarpon rosae]|uniref:Uncharacterized protein n=1 Tax=Diplocarpon rosae TaxID=946125 RepID=A0AAD9T0G7_9HELO|nr:hypothetical protein QTJ16_002494 [Diplocarpon rosae]